ncbi:MAG: pyroglutamyl-peptidase I [Planctomycetota bacterium]
MSRVLITAFEPYAPWEENASWRALVELTRNLPQRPRVTTRLYPVDFEMVRKRLTEDLCGDFDTVLHLGQAPGSSSIQLEAIGLNAKATAVTDTRQPQPLIPGGPVAYQSVLPLGHWAGLLRDGGIPARVSYHAGTFLCNATLFLTHHLCRRNGWRTGATLIHLPLAGEQVLACEQELPSMPSAVAADAIQTLLKQLDSDL